MSLIRIFGMSTIFSSWIMMMIMMYSYNSYFRFACVLTCSLGRGLGLNSWLGVVGRSDCLGLLVDNSGLLLDDSGLLLLVIGGLGLLVSGLRLVVGGLWLLLLVVDRLWLLGRDLARRSVLDGGTSTSRI